jgi:hypothetical protein
MLMATPHADNLHVSATLLGIARWFVQTDN